MREQQKVYKDILDSQVKTKVYGGLMNPYYFNNSNSQQVQYNNARNYAGFPHVNNSHDELSANMSNLNPNLFYNSKLFF